MQDCLLGPSTRRFNQLWPEPFFLLPAGEHPRRSSRSESDGSTLLQPTVTSADGNEREAAGHVGGYPAVAARRNATGGTRRWGGRVVVGRGDRRGVGRIQNGAGNLGEAFSEATGTHAGGLPVVGVGLAEGFRLRPRHLLLFLYTLKWIDRIEVAGFLVLCWDQTCGFLVFLWKPKVKCIIFIATEAEE